MAGTGTIATAGGIPAADGTAICAHATICITDIIMARTSTLARLARIIGGIVAEGDIPAADIGADM
jgi:hypothetical protein